MMLAIVLAMTVILMIGTRGREPGGALIGLAIGTSVAALFCVVRAVLLPRLMIDLPHGVLRTRTGAVPFTRIAVIDVVKEKAGVWAAFSGDDGRTLARMSVADTMFAPPTSDQWAALGQVIQSAATSRGVSLEAQPRAAGNWVSPADAIAIIDAQAAWCSAGQRSSDRRAPATALVKSSIALRPGGGSLI